MGVMVEINKVPSVLILGGGIMQLPSVRIARNKGWKVIVAAREVDGEIQSIADRVEYLDLSDKDAIYRAARKIKAQTGLDGVFTAGTDFSTTVAWVAERLSLPGIHYRAAMAATDKSRMRRAFRQCGVPSPDYYTLRSEVKESRPLNGLSFPLVVKPVDNMGARGVRRVDNKLQLQKAAAEAIRQSRSGRAIIEEYLDGPELSLDAIVYQGKITICGVADRHICFPPFFVEMGHTMPTSLGKDVIEPAVQAFSQGIRALGIDNGAAKGDIKITTSGPIIGEIAARLSGGYMSGWTFPLATGVEVTEAALNIAVGLPPGDLRPRRFDSSAERAFISIPGRVAEILGVQEARQVPGIAELFLRTAGGNRVDFPVNNIGKCGNIISKADSRNQAVAAAEEAVRKIFIRLAPNDGETNRFLFSRGEANSAFKAFSAHCPEVKKALQGLPAYCGEPGDLIQGKAGISILSLPNLARESDRDWHGFSMKSALDKVLAYTGAGLRDPASGRGLNLGKIFWKAFLKGSIQGGVYIIDTLIALRNSPEQLKGLLANNL